MGEIISIWNIENFDEMKLVNFIIISLFLCILSHVSIQFLKSFYHFQISRKKELHFLIFFSLFQVLSLFFMPTSYQKIANLCMMLILLAFLLHFSFWRSLLFSCTLGMIFFIVGRLIKNLWFFFKIGEYQNNVQYEIIFYSMVIGLEIIISMYLRRKTFFFTEETYEMKHRRMCYSMFVFFVMLLSRFFGRQCYLDEHILLLNDIFAVYFYLKIVFMNLEKNCITYQQEHEIENLKMYNRTLTLCTKNIRNFRNDFEGILQDIGGYIKYNEFDSLKNYYQAISEEYKNVKSLCFLNPMVINESAMYNIISNKYYLAKKLGIEVEMEIMMNFKEMNIDTYELGRILGILLDNAIEAAVETAEKKIYLYFQRQKERDFIKIANTYREKEIDINKIFEKGYSTKNKNHGLGLWEVKQILQKHNNLDLYTHKENHIFCQEFSIYHDLEA